MNAAAIIALAVLTAADPREPAANDFKPCVEKGLKWLAAQQKADGAWAGRNDRTPTTITSFAGLALLMEGSTLRDGTYAPELRKAVEWVESRATENGLLANGGPAETTRYIQPHAHAMMFLSSAYDVDDDPARRQRIAKLLVRAVAFASQAQGKRGGWGIVSMRDRADNDDTTSTLLMLQGLFAARKAGIEVPKKLTDTATDYLVKATNATGGVFTRAIDANFPGTGTGQAQLTAGSAAAILMSDDPRPLVFPRWVGNVKSGGARNARLASGAMFLNLQTARVAFALGENGHARLDPTARTSELLRWSSYRSALYTTLKDEQAADGSWPDTLNGPVYSTSLALIILQLDNDYLPAFAR